MIENVFAPLPLIIEQLRREVPDFREVVDIPLAAAVLEKQMNTPNAQVVYDGFVVDISPSGSAGQGKAQKITQRWLIIIGVKNAADQVSKKDSLLAAGALWMRVFRALAGWQPMESAQTLRLATAPRPMYTTTHAYIPIAFEGGLILP